MPPYLRYNVPAERVQIIARINAAIKKLFPLNTTAVKAEDIGFIGGLVVEPSGPTTGVGGVSTAASKTLKGRVSGKALENLAPAVSAKQGSVVLQEAVGAKKAAVASIVPGGVVSVGWNCSADFKADCSTGQTSLRYDWWIECGPDIRYLDTNTEGRIYFNLDRESYYLAAQAGSGTAQFRVLCDISSRSVPKYQVQIDPVILNFNNQLPCVSLQSALFPDEPPTCEVVGDAHGQRPKIRVTLTAPAGPTGQTVFLILNDPHNPKVGRWSSGIDSFEIPFGQTSGEWQGFLGTRKVTSEKTISIRARVNGQESQPLTIKVKKN
jgi:hypothetical protein